MEWATSRPRSFPATKKKFKGREKEATQITLKQNNGKHSIKKNVLYNTGRIRFHSRKKKLRKTKQIVQSQKWKWSIFNFTHKLLNLMD